MTSSAFKVFLIIILIKVFVVSSSQNYSTEAMDDCYNNFLTITEINLKGFLKSLNKLILPYFLRMAEEVEISKSCQISAIRFLKDLIQLKPWTLAMLDAFGKPSAGFLKGANWIAGDYDQCLKIDNSEEKTTTKKSYDIRGKFCYINVDFAKVNSEIVEKITSLKNNTLVRLIGSGIKPVTVSQMISNLKSGVIVFIDVCIPNFCSGNDLQNILNWVTGNDELLTVEGCSEREERRIYSTSQIICLSIIAFFIIWVLIATIAEERLKVSKYSHFIDEVKIFKKFLSVSLNSSLQKLTTVNISEETKWICAIKFFLMNVLVADHIIYMLFYEPSAENLRHVYDMLFNIFFEAVCHGFLFVESFIFLSAFLITYPRKYNRKLFKLSYVHFLAKRYIRLTFPVLCILAFAVILPILVDGPHWHSLANRVKFLESYWWKSILHMFNYENLHTTIISYQWIMNAIFQLNVITVPLLFIIDRWPKIGIMAMIFLSVIGFSLHVVLIIAYNYTYAIGYHSDFQKFQWFITHIYFKPHSYHLSSYCMGLLTGYILSERRVVNFGKITRFTFWICSIILMLLSVYGLHGYISDLSPNKSIILLYNILSPYAWIIGQMWMCIAFTKGHGGVIRRILSLDIFVILDRLNVLIFVLHPFIVLYIIFCIRKPFHFSMLTMGMLYVFVMFLSMIFAFLLYLFFDAPFNFLFKNLFFITNSKETETGKNK